MRIFFTVAIVLIFILQGNGQINPSMNKNHPNIHKIVLSRVIQTTSYTYLQAEVNDELKWMAVPKMDAEAGETYYFQDGMEMGQFKSTELDTVFSSILFLIGVVDPEIVEGGKTAEKTSAQKTEPLSAKTDEFITPVEGGITIEELFSNREKYANKIIRIRGKVTKYNSGIMGKNWIHLQDGTGKAGEFDFTATSQDDVKVNRQWRDIINSFKRATRQSNNNKYRTAVGLLWQ